MGYTGYDNVGAVAMFHFAEISHALLSLDVGLTAHLVLQSVLPRSSDLSDLPRVKGNFNYIFSSRDGVLTIDSEVLRSQGYVLVDPDVQYMPVDGFKPPVMYALTGIAVNGLY